MGRAIEGTTRIAQVKLIFNFNEPKRIISAKAKIKWYVCAVTDDRDYHVTTAATGFILNSKKVNQKPRLHIPTDEKAKFIMQSNLFRMANE